MKENIHRKKGREDQSHGDRSEITKKHAQQRVPEESPESLKKTSDFQIREDKSKMGKKGGKERHI